MKIRLLFLCFSALFCFGVCRAAAGGADEDIGRLNRLKEEKTLLERERDGIGKWAISFRYPLGMSEKAILRETGRLDTKINALNDEFKKIVARRKFRIVEIEIVDKRRENEAEFWEFSIFLNGRRICGAPRSNRRIIRERDVFPGSRDQLTFNEEISLTVTDWYHPENYNPFAKKYVERKLFTKAIRVEDINFDAMEYEVEVEIDNEYGKITVVKAKLVDKIAGKDAGVFRVGSGSNDVHGTFRLRVKFEMCD